MDPDEPLDAPGPRAAWTRRAFVKGCVCASAAGLAIAGSGGVVASLGLGGGAGRRVDYIGATVLGGPAPQGLPLLPLAAGPGGELRGEPRPPGVAGGVLDWYRYCGHAGHPALQPDFRPADELLRYRPSADPAALAELRAAGAPGEPGWYEALAGRVARVADFTAEGLGAPVAWRGARPRDWVPAIALRVDPARLTFHGAPEALVRERFLVPAAGGGALLAYLAWCKHLCCVPGWRDSRKALAQGHFEALFCTCHDSVYDPLAIRGDFFVLREAA